MRFFLVRSLFYSTFGEKRWFMWLIDKPNGPEKCQNRCY